MFTRICTVIAAGTFVVSCGGEAGGPQAESAAAFVTPAELPAAAVGTGYSVRLELSAGERAVESWSVRSGSLPPGLELSGLSRRAGSIGGTPTVAGRFVFTVEAKVGRSEVSQEFRLRVTDRLAFEQFELPRAFVGEAYDAELAGIGGSVPYAWSITDALPSGLELTAEGRITGIPVEPGRSELRTTLTDAEGTSVTETLLLIVDDGPLEIVTASLPSGSTWRPYDATLTARGGSASGYTWSLGAAGVSGVTLSTLDDGRAQFRGLPSFAASYAPTFVVVDAHGNRVEAVFAVDITEGASRLAIETETLPEPVRGDEYAAVIRATGGSEGIIGAYQWSVERLPPGLELRDGPDGQSTLIAGIPTRRGDFRISIDLEDVYDEPGFSFGVSADYDVEVQPGDLFITDIATTAANVDVPFEVEVVAEGGSTVPYIWEIVDGMLPPTLELEPRGAPSTFIRGTPTYPGQYSFTVAVTDLDTNITTERELTITVEGTARPLEASDGNWSIFRRNPTGIELAATGGAELGRVWTLTSGSLPDGVTLEPSGALSGFPRTNGSFSFTARVEDILGLADVAVYEIAVAEPIVIETNDPPRPVPGEPYEAYLTASGGSGVGYTWSVTNGSFSPGLTLSTEPDGRGKISGTTDDLLIVTPEVQVEDSRGNTYRDVYTIRPRRPMRWVALSGEFDDDEYDDVFLARTDGSTVGTSLVDPVGDGGGLISAQGRFITGAIQFSWDGNWMLVYGDWTELNNGQPYVIDVSGDAPGEAMAVPVDLPSQGVQLLYFSWKSKRLYYHQTFPRALKYVDVTPEGPLQAQTVASNVTWFADSEDRDWLYYRTDAGDIFVRDTSTTTLGPTERVCTGGGPSGCAGGGLVVRQGEEFRATLDHVNDQLFFLHRVLPTSPDELFQVDLTAPPPYSQKRISAPLAPSDSIRGFYVAIDGRKLVYATNLGKLYVIDLQSSSPSPQLVAESSTPFVWRLSFNRSLVILDGNFDPATPYDEVFVVDLTGPTPGPVVKVSGEPTVTGCTDYTVDSAFWATGDTYILFEANYDDCSEADIYAVEVKQPGPEPRLRITTDTTRGTFFQVDRFARYLTVADPPDMHLFNLQDPGRGITTIPDVSLPNDFRNWDWQIVRHEDRILYRGADGAYVVGLGGAAPTTPVPLRDPLPDDIIWEIWPQF